MRLFYSTLTNVNFDQDRFPEYIKTAIKHRDAIKKLMEEKSSQPLDEKLKHGPANWVPESYDVKYLEDEGK